MVASGEVSAETAPVGAGPGHRSHRCSAQTRQHRSEDPGKEYTYLPLKQHGRGPVSVTVQEHFSTAKRRALCSMCMGSKDWLKRWHAVPYCCKDHDQQTGWCRALVCQPT